MSDNNIVPKKEDIDIDYEFSRDTYRELISQGTSALSAMAEIAKDSEHPRAFEVLATMLKTNADITEKLIDLQSKKNKISARKDIVPSSEAQSGVVNNLFVGSTSELQKLLSGKDEKDING